MTTHNQLLRLSVILNSDDTIQNHADEIFKINEEIRDIVTDEEKAIISSRIKSKVQKEAEQAFYANNNWGAVLAATGSGKSKIAIDIAIDTVRKAGDKARILISVPTEKLRDVNWLDEFTKWDASYIWEHNVERCCYASLNKYEGETFDLVILDEGHNITENNALFFKQNTVKSCLLLTATKPRDNIKIGILTSLKILPVYELGLDESVKLGLVAPYDITVVTMFLDTTDKYIKAGNKKNTFYNTEKAQYNYLSSSVLAAPSKEGFLRRMRFIYDLRSKTEAAKLILEHVIPKELKTLIFCGSKKQAIQVCERRFFSKPTYTKKKGSVLTPAVIEREVQKMKEYTEVLAHWEGDAAYNDFKEGKINRMSCVNALNEGENIEGLDVAFIVQLNSNDLHLIQRIGRTVRYRPGHIAKIIILCVIDTVEKDWVSKATEKLNCSNIRYIELSHLRMGIEKIIF